jgi:DNA modification methylase
LVRYQSTDGKGILLVGDSRKVPVIPDRSVSVILTSPPYWVRGHGRESATRHCRQIAIQHGPEWWRVLAPRGELWIIMGDRHDGREWIGMDGIFTECLRRAGWSLQTKAFWTEEPSTLRWDDRINYLLRFSKAGVRSLLPKSTLCWHLPIPWSPRGSLWDAMPPGVVRRLLHLSPPGIVLDPFFGSGAVGAVAARMRRPWIGVERDRSQARVAARRLRLRRILGLAQDGAKLPLHFKQPR